MRIIISGFGLVLLCSLTLGCYDDSSLVGDWFKCGNVETPDSTCGSGIHLAEDGTWNRINDANPVADYPYYASTKPDESGSLWETEWDLFGGVDIRLHSNSGGSWSMTEDMTYSLDGNLLVGPTCIMDCSGRPIHWFRITPSRLVIEEKP